MKIKLLFASICLIIVAASTCCAMMSIGHVSKERAKELGMEIRMKATGPGHVWVELEFKTEGRLKDFNPEGFSGVELKIMEGDKSLREGGQPLMTAWLHMRRPSPGQVIVGFDTDRAQINRLILTVVIGSGLMPGGGYEIQVKDFIPDELLKPNPTERRNTASPSAANAAPLTAHINPASPASEKGLLNK